MTDKTPSATPSEFRRLMGSFTSGVSVITATDGQGGVAGMTATAVAAVSLDPPLVSVCVNHSDPLHAVMRRARSFAVNILAEDQVDISQQFAAESSLRFRDVRYTDGPHGVRLLENVVAHILCEPWKTMVAGDHTIFLGRVSGGATFDRQPLLHYQGRYQAMPT